MTVSHYLFSTLFLSAAFAAEVTLEQKPFTVSHSLKGTVLPETFIPLRLDAKSTETFEILSIADHGSMLKKGDPMLMFKSDVIDRKIADLKQLISQTELEIAQAEQDLATAEKTMPEQLSRIERAAKVAEEDLAYFVEIRRKANEESADQSLKRQEQMLASYQEELKQLLKMYEADDITEETEEIILKKQKDAVAYAEHALRMAQLDHKRTLSVNLPRELITLTEKRDDTALQLSKAKQELPRSLALKKIGFAKLNTTLKRQREGLAELEHDREIFDFTAPADGFFYYGTIENGSWTTAEIVKFLMPKGIVPVGKTFASFIPNNSNWRIETFATQADAQALEKGAKGFALLTGREDIMIPATLAKISDIPNPPGTYPATFNAEWPKSVSPVAGQSIDVKVISYSNDKAIAIPTKAIELGTNGWTIQVKLADGKSERRPVTRGKSSGDLTEITAGAEAGQVLIVP